jgi:hypothetical protein
MKIALRGVVIDVPHYNGIHEWHGFGLHNIFISLCAISSQHELRKFFALMSQGIEVPVFLVEDTDHRVILPPIEESKSRKSSKIQDSSSGSVSGHRQGLKTQRIVPTEDQDISYMLQDLVAKSFIPLANVDEMQSESSVAAVTMEKLWKHETLLPKHWSYEDAEMAEHPISEWDSYYEDKLARLSKLKSILTDHHFQKDDSTSTNTKKSFFPSKSNGRRNTLTGSVGDPLSMRELGLAYFQPQAPIVIDEGSLHAVLPPITAAEKYLNFKPRKNRVLTYINNPGILEVDSELEKKSMKISIDDSPIAPVAEPQRKTLRNPRFVDPNERTLVVEPLEVHFEKYVPYQVFHKKLVVRNVSTHSHRYRVTFDPPGQYPTFFELSCPTTPVHDYGLIAPGLSAEYTISFRPNSYARTTESLVVQSETGESLKIPILACQEPPVLTLPETINIGNCMDSKVLNFSHTITNCGGDARFIVMTPSVPLGPFELFEKLGPLEDDETRTVHYGPFQIYPSYFRLRKGESVQLKIKYSPALLNTKKAQRKDAQKTDSQFLRIACDNCTVIEVKITAKAMQPCIQFVSAIVPKDGTEYFAKPQTAGGNAQPVPFEIDLGLENFGVPKMGTIRVRNPLDIELPFRWKFLVHSDNEEEKDHYLKKGLDFGISPTLGILHPQSEIEFKVCFMCHEPKRKSIVAEIIATEDANSKPELKDSQKNVSLGIVQLFGEAIPYHAYVNTSCIFIPNGIHAGDTFSQKISFTNASLSELDYRWEFNGLNSDKISGKISHPSGIIGPGTCISLSVSLTGLFPGHVLGQLYGFTANGVGPTMVVTIVGTISFKPGDLSVAPELIDMGLIPLGLMKKVKVPIKNSTKVTMTWKASMYTRNEDSKDSLLIVSPPSGMLNPGESQLLTLSYIPLWYQQLRATLLIHSLDPNDEKTLLSATDMVATTLTPRVVVENPTNSLACFVDVPFTCKVTLRNERALTAYFKWQNIVTNEYSVEFEELEGTVPPNSSCDKTLKLRYFQAGAYDTDITGSIDAMVEDFGLLNIQIHAEVVEPSFRFQVVENEEAWDSRQIISRVHKPRQDSDASLRIDFGMACPVFVVRTRTLKIRNHSALSCAFEIKVEKYPAMYDENQAFTLEQNSGFYTLM